MADLIVIAELQDYLVAQGIAEHPSTKAYVLPSVWLLPRKGAPLPRTETELTTITLSRTVAQVPGPLEEWMEDTFVDVVVRARSAPTGELVQRRIHDLIVPIASSGGHKQWMMGALLVEIADEWRGLQPLPQRQDIAADDPRLTVDTVASYRFSVRRKILAGLAFP